MDKNGNIVITGGAGLVGQNLVVALLQEGFVSVTVIDKSRPRLDILRGLHPSVRALEADLSRPGPWREELAGADVVVTLHAQIGGAEEEPFHRNNIEATRNVLAALENNPGCYLLHLSSSVVNSRADDFYTRSKQAQEDLVQAAPQPWFILRPTVMFGWFDPKHFGWLSRFMRRSPVFPIPGNGRYLRQPLYAGDFCRILLACIEHRPSGEGVNISGKQKVPFIEIIRQIRAATGARTLLLPLPKWLFALCLRVHALFDRDPPFTVYQMRALVIDELFEDNDWEGRFGVRATPLRDALEETFRHPRYSRVILEY